MTIKYGRLTYLHDLPDRSADKHIVSVWKCDCGKETNVVKSRVIHGKTKSCGCLAKETKSALTHGMRLTKEYNTWAQIKGRCHLESNKDFPRYGAKGITVFEPWRNSFELFFEYMGYAPSKKHQIDRINTRGNYEPGNVKWSTPQEQCRNTVAAYDWYIKGLHFPTSKEAGIHFGISEQSIHKWVKGYFDKRRGTFAPAKKYCYAVLRYAESL